MIFSMDLSIMFYMKLASSCFFQVYQVWGIYRISGTVNGHSMISGHG